MKQVLEGTLTLQQIYTSRRIIMIKIPSDFSTWKIHMDVNIQKYQPFLRLLNMAVSQKLPKHSPTPSPGSAGWSEIWNRNGILFFWNAAGVVSVWLLMDWDFFLTHRMSVPNIKATDAGGWAPWPAVWSDSNWYIFQCCHTLAAEYNPTVSERFSEYWFRTSTRWLRRNWKLDCFRPGGLWIFTPPDNKSWTGNYFFRSWPADGCYTWTSSTGRLQKKKFPVQELVSAPFLLLSKGANSDATDIFSNCGLNPKVHIVTWDDYAIMSMVEKGLGISVLPQLILQRIPYHILTKELECSGLPPCRTGS